MHIVNVWELPLATNIFNLASVFRKSSLLRVPGQPGNQGNLEKELLFPVGEKSGNFTFEKNTSNQGGNQGI